VYVARLDGDDAGMSRGRRANPRLLFGRRLRALRKLRMFTQEKLGERAGVSGKLVGQIERGDGNPTFDVIVGLAAGLDIEPATLLQFEEERPTGPPAGAAGAFAAAERVSRYLARRPASEVERALRILEAALEETRAVK
jgi:transcriptional regulator with XRE-family HTH domain